MAQLAATCEDVVVWSLLGLIHHWCICHEGAYTSLSQAFFRGMMLGKPQVFDNVQPGYHGAVDEFLACLPESPIYHSYCTLLIDVH